MAPVLSMEPSPDALTASAAATETMLRSCKHVPISQLSPSIVKNSSATDPTAVIKAIVTLVWPYSASNRSISFLLAEPDFRLRRNRGQVRVRFHGASAKAVARTSVSSGDEIALSLLGAEFVTALENEPPSTPGASIEWELRFGDKLLLEVSQQGQSKIVHVDSPPETPSDEAHPPAPAVEVSVLPPQTPETTSIASRPHGQDDLSEWSSPAFIKRARTSYGSLFENGYDVFAEQDRGRKRPRLSRLSSTWRYASRSPSPENEQEDGDEVRAGSNRSSPQPTSAAPQPQMMDEGCQTVDLDPEAMTTLFATPAKKAIHVETTTPIAMPPPTVPHIQIDTQIVQQTSSTSSGVNTSDTSQQPSSPRIAPVPSPLLPMVSPFPQAKETSISTFFPPHQQTSAPWSSLLPDNPIEYKNQPEQQTFEAEVQNPFKAVSSLATDSQATSNNQFENQFGHWQPMTAAYDHPSEGFVSKDIPNMSHAEPTYPAIMDLEQGVEGQSNPYYAESQQLHPNADHSFQETASSFPDQFGRPVAASEHLASSVGFESFDSHAYPQFEHEHVGRNTQDAQPMSRSGSARSAPVDLTEESDAEGEVVGEVIYGEISTVEDEYEDGASVRGDEDIQVASVHTSDNDSLAEEDVAEEDIEDEEVLDESISSYDEGSGEDLSPARRKLTIYSDEEGHYYSEGDEEEEEEEAEDEMEYDEEYDESASENKTSAPPQRPQEPIVIDLLSSDDEDEASEPPPTTSALQEPQPIEESIKIEDPTERDLQDDEPVEEEEGYESEVDEPQEPDDETDGKLTKPELHENPESLEETRRVEKTDDSVLRGDDAKEVHEDVVDTVVEEHVSGLLVPETVIARELISPSRDPDSEVPPGNASSEPIPEDDLLESPEPEEDLESPEHDSEFDAAESKGEDNEDHTDGEYKLGEDEEEDDEEGPEAQLVATQLTSELAQLNETERASQVTLEAVTKEQTSESSAPLPTENNLNDSRQNYGTGFEDDGTVRSDHETTDLKATKTAKQPKKSRKKRKSHVDTTYRDTQAEESEDEEVLPLDRDDLELQAAGNAASQQMRTDGETSLTAVPQGRNTRRSEEAAETRPVEQMIDDKMDIDGHGSMDHRDDETKPTEDLDSRDQSTSMLVDETVDLSTKTPSTIANPILPEDSRGTDNRDFASNGQLPTPEATQAPLEGMDRPLTEEDPVDTEPSVILETQEGPSTPEPPPTRATRMSTRSAAKASQAPENDVATSTSPQSTRPRRSRRTRSISAVIEEKKELDEHDAVTEAAHAEPIVVSPAASSKERTQVTEAESGPSIRQQLARSLRTDLSEFTQLQKLRVRLDKKIDVLAIVTTTPAEPQRARGGPRHYQLSFNITDVTIGPSNIATVQVFRPHREALPYVEEGDGILLRDFTVQAVKTRGFGLKSATDTSSWAVFKKDDSIDIRGPPVELGEGEKHHIALLKSWYQNLDDTARLKLTRANK